jgi:hypothetical protein
MDREDVVDPYLDYFATGVLGGMAGGLRGYPVLGAEPYRIEVDLNDWFRFDRPGTYRLYLKSHRLSRERTTPFAAVSNLLTVEIVADDASWSSTKLHQIEAVLVQPEPEMPVPGGPPVPVNPLEAQLRSARRDLRYLSTPEAVAMAFQDARKLGGSPDTLLLFGARNRAQMIAAFDRYLADPVVPVREWDIRLRAFFNYVRTDSPKPLPLYSWQVPADVDWKDIWAEAEPRQKRFAEFVQAEAVRLIPVVIGKTATARKVSGEAIAAIAPAEARAALLVPPADFGLSRGELIAQFPSFPAEQQAELLGKKWDLVRGPEMIPALRDLAGRAEPGALPKSAMNLQVWGVRSGLGEAALRRLYELAPKEAVGLVAKDLAQGIPRFAGFAARELPAQAMPEADGVFLRWLASGEFGALPLIARFGSVNLSGAMRERYLSRSWPCAEEGAFLAYFVRNLAGSASEMLQRSFANREGRGCHHFLLGQVASIVWNRTLEAQAVQLLADPDPETVASAAQALGAYGGAAAEPYLWTRLEAWSERWRGRTREFEVHPITGGTPNPESNVGPALAGAIGSAKAWYLDESRRRRLHGLCLDEACRERWSRTRSNSNVSIDVSNGGWLYPAEFRVDGYQAATLAALQEKLLQYPEGTVFRWCPQESNPFDAFTPGQREEMYRQLKSVISARELRLEPSAQDRCTLGGY